jgi:uncharacterized Zn finger protein (UPF0148 family)
MHMKKTGEMQCPGCELPVRMEADVKSSGMSYSNTSSTAAAASADPLVTSPLKSPPTHSHHQVKAAAAPAPIDFDYDYEAEGQHEGDAAQPFQSFEEMKREYDAAAKKRGDVSSLLGDRMLGGWAMMGVNCENDDCGTPLMKKPRSEEMECVSCGALYEEKGGTLVTTQPGALPAAAAAKRSNSVSEYAPEKVIESTRTTTTAQESGDGVNYGNNAFDVNDAPTLSFAMSGRDGDASSKIANKLLLGWAMLDEVCDNQDCDCNAPLMRDKTGETHCVGCGPVNPALDRPVTMSGSNEATPPSSAQRGASNRDTVHDTGDLLDDEEDEEVFRQYAKKRFAAALAGADTKAIPHPTTATAAAAASSANSNSNSTRTRPANPNLDLGETLTQTSGAAPVLAVLQAKMHSSADALRQSSHVRDSTELADLILKLALAAKAVAALEVN